MKMKTATGHNVELLGTERGKQNFRFKSFDCLKRFSDTLKIENYHLKTSLIRPGRALRLFVY
jgi:hypothetical protein